MLGAFTVLFVAFVAVAPVPGLGGLPATWHEVSVDRMHHTVRVDLAVDATDSPHLAFVWNQPNGPDPLAGMVAYAHENGDSWVVEDVAQYSPWNGDEPRILLDADGVPSIYFAMPDPNLGGRVVYEARPAPGTPGQWALTALASGEVFQPVAARWGDVRGAAYRVALADGESELRFAEWTGSWGPPVTIGRFAIVLGYDLAYDAEGVPHVAFVADTSAYHASRPAGSWITERIADFTTSSAPWVGVTRLIAGDGDALHVAIFRSPDSPNGLATVYYFRREASSWHEAVLASDGRSCLGCTDADLAVDPAGNPYLLYEYGFGGKGVRLLYDRGGVWQENEVALPSEFNTFAFSFAIGADGTGRYAWVLDADSTLWYATQASQLEPVRPSVPSVARLHHVVAPEVQCPGPIPARIR